MARPFGSTRNWAIAWRGIVSATLGVGVGEVNIAWFLLWPTGLNWGCPVIFQGAGIGAGAQVQPFVVGPFTSFNTMSGGAAGGGNCLPSDFNSFGSVLFSSAGPGAGGSVSLNFYSVDHSPNPIICSGVPVGGGAAGGWTSGRFTAMPAISIDIDVCSGARTSLYAGGAGGYVLTDSSDSLDDITHQSIIKTTFLLYFASRASIRTACDEMGADLIIGRWKPSG